MARLSITSTLFIVLVALATATATAQPTTTAPAHSKTSTSSKCASTFDGCLKCNKATTTCTKCRANSTWDDLKQACVCNSADGNYGTLPKDVFDQYVSAVLCRNKKHCKRPNYAKTIANKCVQCDKYFGGVSIDGQCVGFTATYRDTKLTIVNGIADPGTGPWSSAYVVANMGQCSVGCNLDPNYLVPRNLAPGTSTNAQGWNPAASADITADLKFCASWTLPDVCLSAPTIIRVEAGNPRVGWPWVTIGGVEHKFSEGESWEVTGDGGHRFSVKRNNDLDGAKDMVVTILS